jgi:hypothetical protein
MAMCQPKGSVAGDGRTRSLQSRYLLIMGAEQHTWALLAVHASKMEIVALLVLQHRSESASAQSQLLVRKEVLAGGRRQGRRIGAEAQIWGEELLQLAAVPGSRQGKPAFYANKAVRIPTSLTNPPYLF